MTEPGVPAADLPTGPWQETAHLYLGHLLRGAELDAILLAEAKVLVRYDLGPFYDQVLTPALREVGRLWEAGSITVAAEHRASAIARRTCDALFHLLVPFRRTRGRAIISAATSDAHDLGARILADLLAGAGWDVTFLGARTSERELLSLIRHGHPHVLGLSLALPSDLGQTRALIERVRQEPGAGDRMLIVGGPLFATDPELWRTLGADAYAPSAQAAIAVLEAWWRTFTGAC